MHTEDTQQKVEEIVLRLNSLAAESLKLNDLQKSTQLLGWVIELNAWISRGQPAPPPPALNSSVVYLSQNDEPLVSDGDWKELNAGTAQVDDRPAEDPVMIDDASWDSPPPSAAERPRVLKPGEYDITRLRRFPGIEPEAFQHPLDVKALRALKAAPGLDTLASFINGAWYERQSWLINNAHCLKIGPNQAKSIYEKFQHAAAILDLKRLPDIYVSTAYIVNATSSGYKRYQITLYSGLIEMLTEEELLAVIGHELGHIKCQHMLYNSVANWVTSFGLALLDQIPGIGGLGKAVTIPALWALLEWRRKAELSCDRAALLVVQKPEVVASALTKLAGGSKKILPELDLDAVDEQARDFENEDQSWLTKFLRLNMLLNLGNTHPYPILRVREIREWGRSSQYRDIMAGNYKRTAPPSLRNFSGPVALKCQCGYLSSPQVLYCKKCGESTNAAKLVCGVCEIEVQAGEIKCPRGHRLS